jgi:hypothetical protein
MQLARAAELYLAWQLLRNLAGRKPAEFFSKRLRAAAVTFNVSAVSRPAAGYAR